jgi:hypothetical protein
MESIMKHAMTALVSAAVLVTGYASSALADSIAAVEGARAEERSGRPLTRQEVDKLRRYGSNDDGYYSGGYGHYYDSPSVSVYAGPGYGYAAPGPGYDYDDPYED